jgi:hypothetical protein
MYLVTLDEDDMLQVVMESSSWFTMEHKYFNMTKCAIDKVTLPPMEEL